MYDDVRYSKDSLLFAKDQIAVSSYEKGRQVASPVIAVKQA